MKRALLTAGALTATLALAAASASGQSPASQPESDAAVYQRECALCHGTVGTGTLMLARRLGEDNAILANRDNLAPAYVEYVVRNGIGSMPAITRVEVTDAQLAQIVRHLTDRQEEAE